MSAVATPKGLNYWQKNGELEAWLSRCDPPSEADFVIVGGGLAGLSTAIAILERQPGANVAILEAQAIGFGASGRNGGLLSPLPAPVWLLTADSNADHAWALRALNDKLHATAAWLAENVPESEIRSCTLQLQAMGRLTTSGAKDLASTLETVSVNHRLEPDPARGGKPTLALPGYTVNPYRLVQALAGYAASRGARICERANVVGISDASDCAFIRLASGQKMRAGKVVLCTNAYTGSIKLPSSPRAKVVHNYMVATERLEEAAVARLGSGREFIVELNKSYVFYRLHQGRLLYGGIDTFFRFPKSDHDVPLSIRSALERLLVKSIPWCKGVKISAAWGGRFHSTATDLPIIRRASDCSPIVFNVGYGGTGVALTLLCANHAAAIALDLPLQSYDDSRLYATMRSTPIPLRGLLRFGGRIAGDVARSYMARN